MNLVSEQGVFHAVLGGFVPDEGSVQKLCDQRLANVEIVGDGMPTCPKCKQIVEEKDRLMKERSGNTEVVEKEEGMKDYTLPPPLPGRDGLTAFYRRLSLNVGDWSTYNFGENPSYRQALGMIEEVIELKQGLEESDRDKVVDAIADITIYMADYYAKRVWDMGELACVPEWECTGLMSCLDSIIGKLAHHQLKSEQGIRGSLEEHEIRLKDVCARTISVCMAVASLCDVDFPEVVMEVWNAKVSKRDWVENPEDAADVVDAELEEGQDE